MKILKIQNGIKVSFASVSLPKANIKLKGFSLTVASQEFVEVATTDDELRSSVNFVSAEYNELRATKSQIESDVDRNLSEIAKKGL